MSQISSRSLDAEESSEFEAYERMGLKLLGSIHDETEPAQIVAAVNQYVDSWQKSRRGLLQRLRAAPDNIEPSLALGIVWGNQLVRRFSWSWRYVLLDGHERYGVVSPDCSLVVYATYFIKECLDRPNADCTALLTFNMLETGNIPVRPSDGYFSLLGSVRRLVEKGLD